MHWLRCEELHILLASSSCFLWVWFLRQRLYHLLLLSRPQLSCSRAGTQPVAAALALPRPRSPGAAPGSDSHFSSAAPAHPALPSPQWRQRCSCSVWSCCSSGFASAKTSPLLPMLWQACSTNQHHLPGQLSSVFYQSTPLASLSSHPSNTALPPQPSLPAQLLPSVFHHATFSLALNIPSAPGPPSPPLCCTCWAFHFSSRAYFWYTQSFITIYLRQLCRNRTCRYLNFAPCPLPPCWLHPLSSWERKGI